MAVGPNIKCEESNEKASARSLGRSAFSPKHPDKSQAFKKAIERVIKVNKENWDG